MVGESAPVPPQQPLPPPEPAKSKCDLIMKGGITSGIVYPPAIFELQKYYVFRNIGGTSAGAVAAVGAAAAEYSRAGGDVHGFNRLQTRGEALGSSPTVGKASPLRNLFQASPQTQVLMDILDAILAVLSPETDQTTSSTTGAADPGARANTGSSTNGATPPTPTQRWQLKSPFLSLFQRFLPATLDPLLAIADHLASFWSGKHIPYQPYQAGSEVGIRCGIGVGIVLAIIASLCLMGIFLLIVPINSSARFWILLITFLILGLVGGIAGGWLGRGFGRIIAILIDIVDLLSNRLAQNYYGICLGHTTTDAQSDQAPDGTNLTDWLSDTIQDIAGRPRTSNPLTFGDLKDKQVELNLVTSNLSHRIPYVVPHDLQNFLFHEDDMNILFPRYIVRHLIEPPSADSDDPNKKLVLPKLPEKYHYLPSMQDLPVLFGARLSLSFPFLVSAVPLYTISADAYRRWSELPPDRQKTFVLDKERDLQKNWFSDGGISSNFPMQFFDAWLPLYPTFGINLTTAPNATSALVGTRSDDQSVVPVVTELKGDMTEDSYVYLPRAADRQDLEWQNIGSPLMFAQGILGTSMNYRDTLQANLPSYRERIVQVRLVADEGGLNLNMPRQVIDTVMKKGREAGGKLSPAGEFNFDYHWWVRFLVLMDQLEQNIVLIQQVLDGPTQGIEQRIDQQLLAKDPPYPYSRDAAWCDHAKKRVKALQDLIHAWYEVTPSGEKVLAFHDRAPTPNPILRLTPEV